MVPPKYLGGENLVLAPLVANFFAGVLACSTAETTLVHATLHRAPYSETRRFQSRRYFLAENSICKHLHKKT